MAQPGQQVSAAEPEYLRTDSAVTEDRDEAEGKEEPTAVEGVEGQSTADGPYVHGESRVTTD